MIAKLSKEVIKRCEEGGIVLDVRRAKTKGKILYVFSGRDAPWNKYGLSAEEDDFEEDTILKVVEEFANAHKRRVAKGED